ncbi:MAG: glutathione synthase [Actinomycetota bacterium]
MARHLFIADPIEALDPRRDTTVAMIETARRRGHTTYIAAPLDLSIDESGPWCRVAEIVVRPAQLVDEHWVVDDIWYAVGEPERRALADFASVSMRVRPPVDRAYLNATFILDHADLGTAVVNRSAGLRVANEKTFAIHTPEILPPTVVTADRSELADFTRRQGRAVLKPLDGSPGRGVHQLRPDDPNLRAIIDTATEGGRVQVIAQGFGSATDDVGDRRVLVLDGEPIGSFARLTGGDDVGGDTGAEAMERADEPDEVVHMICERLAPFLTRLGLHVVGLDVIGDRLTEVNVAAPTGARQILRFGGVDVADRYVEFLEGQGWN